MKAEREKVVEKERSESLEKMMDKVAHEMRNPLTLIAYHRCNLHCCWEGSPDIMVT